MGPCSNDGTRWREPIIINSVFVSFSVSLFAVSHSLTFKRSWLSFDSISSTVGALMERVVSCANNLALVVWRHLGKSLIYKRNKNGPRLDPCGTPHLSSFTSDCLPLIEQICFLLLK